MQSKVNLILVIKIIVIIVTQTYDLDREIGTTVFTNHQQLSIVNWQVQTTSNGAGQDRSLTRSVPPIEAFPRNNTRGKCVIWD
jgi:hypothetical protein